MNGFIFASGVNDPSKGAGADATGAFRPGAEAFKRINGIRQDIFYFDWRVAAGELRRTILERLRTVPCDDPDGLDVVAYFGHGIPRGLSSAKFYSSDTAGRPSADVQELASAIASVSKNEVRIVLRLLGR